MRIFWWSILMMVGLSWGCGSDSMTGNPSGAAGATTAGAGEAPGGAAGSTPGSAGRSSGASGAGTTGASGMASGGKAGMTSMTPPAAGTPSTAAGAGAGTGGATAGSGTGTAGMPSMMAGMSGGSGTGAMTGMSSCGPATSISPANLGDVKMLGPFKPMMKASSGPSGSSTLFYPSELGMNGITHPIFHWGCGAGSQPSQYADHLNLLASHGFVVIANASGSSPAVKSLDWMIAENDKMGSMFYKKLDPNRIAIGGHSLGALETMSSAKDPRIKNYILVCGGCMSGRGGCGAADIHGPTVILGGDTDIGTPNFDGDYAEIKSPVVFVTKTGTDHIACARNNLGPWVAFMRWQLCGETQYQKEFTPDGTYCKSPWQACKSKGFM
ncbi:MAG TPA: hypothetical protein VJV78_32800 [Polyangiales bacterium]|nr:hypothetical protein [Polyangiales bacterium]